MNVNKKTNGTILIDIIKTVIIIIWATLPITFISTADMYQDTTPLYLKWIFSISIILFTVVSINFYWSYYKKITDSKIQKISLKDIGISFGLFTLLKVVTIIGSMLNEIINGSEMTSNDAALQVTDSLLAFPMYLIIFNLIISFAAPILEELALRGIFTNIWFRNGQKFIPALLSSTIFSLTHGFDNIVTFLMYFTAGLIYFFAYCRRWNIKDSILLHILNNGFIVILKIFLV